MRRWVVLIGLLCLGIAVWAKTDHIMPGIPVPPEYPDEQAVIVKGGSISFSLQINGTVTRNPQPDVTVIHTLKVTARETIGISGAGGTRNYSYQATDTIVQIKNGKRSTMVTTTRSNGTKALKPQRDSESVLAPMAMSIKQGAACANLVSAIGGGQWEIPDIQGEMKTEGLTLPTDGLCTVRIPCYGNTGGVFSKQINAWEASGIGEFGLPMGDVGYVEMPWRNGGGFGQFSTGVLAWNIGPGVQVNSTPATKAMFAKRDTSNVDFFSGSLNVSWQLGAVPQKCELKLAPSDGMDVGRAKLAQVYEKWLPEPKFAQTEGATPLTIQAELTAKNDGEPSPRGRIDFYLTDVSRHRGECCNYPRDRGEKDDLRFADEQADYIKIDPGNPLHAWTTKPVERAFVRVMAEDGGAYGRLKAECKDLNLLGLYEPLGTYYMSIPKDDDGNHVADAWEEEKGVSGQTTDSDEEEVGGQTTTGDGMSLYREYRGFMVLDNGKATYKRLHPKEKDLFVIDAGGIFGGDLWKKAAEMTVYKVDDSLVQGGGDVNTSRIVDYTFGDPTGQHKYAVRLEAYKGMEEKTPYRNQPADASTCYGYTDNQGNSPRTTERCVVFPDRIRAMIDRVAGYIQEGVSDPNSEGAKALKEADLPIWLAQNALKKLGPATRDLLAQQMVTMIAIHEMGHACGVTGHLVGGKESDQGDPKCPMKYTDRAENRKLLILQVLFALDHPLPLQYDRFCQSSPYQCFTHLNVKD